MKRQKRNVFTFDQLCRNLRAEANITVDDFVALSREGAMRAIADGMFLNPIHRTTVFRFESDNEADRVTRPQEGTLWTYCYTMAMALEMSGAEPRSAQELEAMLRSSLREIVMEREVSREAALLDSVMRTIGEPARSQIYEVMLAQAKQWQKILKARALERKVAKASGDES